MRPRWEPLPEGLLEDVRAQLDITWTDEATDRKIAEAIYAGMDYLDGKAGERMDYLWPGPGRTLLMEFVRYYRDGALDVFENNYRHLILSMQNDRKVWNYAEESLSGRE
ncbi:hypothetical protein AALC17_05195 [Oscillospiraceae bacterium 38-13]